MAKTILVFPARLLAKAHVAGYTRKDGAFVREHDDKRKATPRAKKASTAKTAVKTNNEGWGFHGEASNSYIRKKYDPDFDHGHASESDINEARAHADRMFQGAADHLVQAKHFDNHEQARDYLDSRNGRHLHDSSDDGEISGVKWLAKDVANYKKKLPA